MAHSDKSRSGRPSRSENKSHSKASAPKSHPGKISGPKSGGINSGQGNSAKGPRAGNTGRQTNPQSDHPRKEFKGLAPAPKVRPPISDVLADNEPNLFSGGDFQRIYGKHHVREALTTQRPVYKLWIAQSLTTAVMREFQQLARDRDVPVQIVPHAKLQHLLAHLDQANHQGLVAEIGAYDYADWDTWLKNLKASDKEPFVLVLDQIQDPHNLGAILRTAEAAGVHGVVIPRHGSVGLSETVAKASAGAIETVPVLQVTNLARALEELKDAGLWIMGLSANEGQNYFQANLKGPIVLVIGSEHKGLRPNVESHCDHKLIIPMLSTRSLNASVAAAVAMFEIVRQRQTASKP